MRSSALTSAFYIYVSRVMYNNEEVKIEYALLEPYAPII